MSGLVLPEDSHEPEVPQYQPSEKDEESFFLMYNLHLQPSEIDAMSEEYRRWVIGRFVAQKSMEREFMERQHLAAKVSGNIRG